MKLNIISFPITLPEYTPSPNIAAVTRHEFISKEIKKHYNISVYIDPYCPSDKIFLFDKSEIVGKIINVRA